ncbi:MAG: universal stress protein [Actinobacteria bacterium]|nr:universal stress protein [Actinomycetota bacterium]
MFDVILVATDGSSTAMRAEERAAMLARRHGATLHAVFAYGPAKSSGGPFAESGANPGEVGRGALTGVQKRYDDLEVRTHLVEGKVVDAIAEVARTTSADLVVVGNVGLGSRVQRARGSVPHELAHHAPTDVLIVHTSDAVHRERADHGGPLTPYQRVVVGVDGSDTSLEALRRAAGVAAEDGAEIVIVNAGGDDEVLSRASDVAAEAGVTSTRRGDDGAPAEVLVRVSTDERADLLVEIGAEPVELGFVAQFASLDDLVKAGRERLVVGWRCQLPVAPGLARPAAVTGFIGLRELVLARLIILCRLALIGGFVRLLGAHLGVAVLREGRQAGAGGVAHALRGVTEPVGAPVDPPGRGLGDRVAERVGGVHQGIGLTLVEVPLGPPRGPLHLADGQLVGGRLGHPGGELVRLVDHHDVVLRDHRDALDGVDRQQGVVGDDQLGSGGLLLRPLGEALLAVGALRRAQALAGAH